ncbi:leucine-rich repeat, immunoglobulin-like domain and transmembrane domain-containing protein 2 [Solea senegalensis]|uniref:leucine-rich repeat, immunoglobulin-like domain and transmembrane domain-containing protein 2 isoform X2 n=1 Tax=Solea senegalensis TaxID=28829 RepID=UPI001C421D2B|nr:leucine-rich repeat, immunoglobulin-like domain and transmembrane domain-containing protein 2 isoform X2 [Solea senegalensis]KAG7512116.1 leucine-rich repeat, immunoglobulin-like domain and transmembrane domain-containing protein 2 [Solea senegalensis]
MDIIHYLLVTVVFIFKVHGGFSQCLRGCSCIEDRHGRSLICMEEGAFGTIPQNLPDDMTKIRIEKSHFTEIPRGAFSKTPSLENLWLNFNDITLINSKGLEGLRNLTELRLQGNKLRSVPWAVFEDTTALKILDLKHNQLDVLPEHALKFLPGLTYLDLSFNRLTVISKEVFQNWPLYQKLQSVEGDHEPTSIGSNVVLALHNNSWLCDCRLKGFVEFIRSLSPPIILMNSYLTCSGPDSRVGKFFHEVELQACMKPVVSSPTSNISLPLGTNLTLRCLAKARPDPTVWWTYGLKIIRGFHESQERVDEDTIRSLLVIPSLHTADHGIFTCTAVNFIGNSSVSIFLDVLSPDDPHSSRLPGAAPSAPSNENVFIDVRIAKQTVRGISIEWYAALERPAETWFTIHFGRADTDKREMIYIGPGIHSYSVSDLLPATKYEICVTLKSQTPRPGQCIVFVTGSDITEMEQREKLIHIVVIVLAMVLAVPIGMFACTTDTKFACLEGIMKFWKKRRREGRSSETEVERQGTFDSLQAASDEGLVNKDSSEDRKVRRRSDDRGLKGKSEQSRITAELY